ncbi:hypothetical protein GCM10010915_13340 [Microbacterium faecale]|uniref:DUF4260 domain-containing protein n=1 Tax=Microbacterium faecale TaxID=1804630 RepID=A0A917DES8_9MICO|nr:DUF4260 domain-containing protein [Microbacterium faecale]GGD34286.1 hypothetical protein GCM10010915_13340 [Microbacterium faecale]HJB63897.1 DUF4260 domain-containing protein [Candidatus Microbacterium pullistercoris]
MSDQKPQRRAVGWQRLENALVASAIVVAMIAWGQPWWILLAAFLAFDISALGYVINERVGAFCYNLVHNYAAPAALITVWAGLQLGGVSLDWIAVVAASWGFHVAVDRALGFGLKLGPFGHTHLGILGTTAGSRKPSSEARKTSAGGG